jgi:phenylalanyl-tRNA synthetase alpha chain
MAKRSVTVAAVDVEALEREAQGAITAASTRAALDDARVRYLGRKSELKQALRGVRDRESGMSLNAARERLEAAFDARESELEWAELDRTLTEDVVDVTLPGTELPRGHVHLLTQMRREIEDTFLGLGYEVFDGPEVEETHYNFDALNTPEGHPSRSPVDTFYVSDDVVLRTHTSPGQIRYMQSHEPPVYMVSLGRCYRRDTPDPTHTPTFHQVEGLAVDRTISLADLKGTLLHLARVLFGEERDVRVRTSFFPFTEPSAEFDVSCFLCAGSGCNVCKWSGWIEMGGCGVVDPNVFAQVGYDPERWSGFAFGLGIDRIAMLRHGVPDLRLHWENDLRYLSQF